MVLDVFGGYGVSHKAVENWDFGMVHGTEIGTEKRVDQSTTHEELCLMAGESPLIHGEDLDSERKMQTALEKDFIGCPQRMYGTGIATKDGV